LRWTVNEKVNATTYKTIPSASHQPVLNSSLGAEMKTPWLAVRRAGIPHDGWIVTPAIGPRAAGLWAAHDGRCATLDSRSRRSVDVACWRWR
jgi:hypothetical protein